MSFDNVGSGSVALAPYWFKAHHFPSGQFTVHSVRGVERLSEPFVWEITATASALIGDSVERLAIDSPASLVIRTGPKPRAIFGVIEEVEFEGLRQAGKVSQMKFRLVPTFARLKLVSGFRIFQKKTVPEIIRAVLAEHGVGSRWHLTERYPAKDYVTQLPEETDLEFVHRLIAEAGIFYTIAHPAKELSSFLDTVEGLIDNIASDFVDVAAAAVETILHPSESLVFGDNASTYPTAVMSDAEDVAEEVVAAAVGLASDVLGGVGSAVGDVLGAGVQAGMSLEPLAMHLGPSPTLSYMSAEGLATTRHDKVFSFVGKRKVCSDFARYRVFDPARPESPHESRAGDFQSLASTPGAAFKASLTDPMSAVGSLASTGIDKLLGLVSQRQYETYKEGGHFHFPDPREAEAMAARIRRRTTRDRVTGSGTSGCPALFAGARFRLEDHPLADANAEHVAIEVEHFGEVGKDAPVYENRFRTVPANVTYVPELPKRRPIQVIVPAIVVGAPGEEIDVDAEGRVKLWFPEDRRGPGPESSCRVRVMQFWAQAAFGAHFIPRVGAEVWVSFVNGDPDMPVIVGCAWDATRPSPYLLPANKTQSGIKTQSTPGGGGSNELRFEDKAGREEVYVHAQRDLREEVNHDYLVLIKNDEKVEVQGHRRDEVGKNAFYEVQGNRDETVHGDTSVHHLGSRVDVVEKNLDQRVTGHRTVRLESQDQLDVRGRAEHRYQEDRTTRVVGNDTVIVGKHDAKRSHTTRVEGVATISAEDGLVLESAKGITLKCGNTILRIGPDGVEILGGNVRVAGEKGSLEAGKEGLTFKSEKVHAHFGDSALIKTEAASLAMGTEFKADGTKILFNSPEQATDRPPPEPKPPTEIELKSDDAKPLPNQPFVIQLDDESERSGVTDKNGKATLDLPSRGSIRFPNLGRVACGRASSDPAVETPWRPYVVQQGDHLDKLANRAGVDRTKIWEHPENGAVSKKRKANILCPGDILMVPIGPRNALPLESGTSNRYTARMPKTRINLIFGSKRGVLSDEEYDVRGAGEPIAGKTDGEGRLSVDVPLSTREILVVFPRLGRVIPVRVGDLDPVEEESGVRQRLQNLGLYREATEGAHQLSTDEMADVSREAIEIFQRSVGLLATGYIDDATRAALVKHHGS